MYGYLTKIGIPVRDVYHNSFLNVFMDVEADYKKHGRFAY